MTRIHFSHNTCLSLSSGKQEALRNRRSFRFGFGGSIWRVCFVFSTELNPPHHSFIRHRRFEFKDRTIKNNGSHQLGGKEDWNLASPLAGRSVDSCKPTRCRKRGFFLHFFFYSRPRPLLCLWSFLFYSITVFFPRDRDSSCLIMARCSVVICYHVQAKLARNFPLSRFAMRFDQGRL